MPKAKSKRRRQREYSRTSLCADIDAYEVKWEMPTHIQATRNDYTARKRLDSSPLNGTPMSDEKRMRLQAIDPQTQRDQWFHERPYVIGATNVVKAVGLGYKSLTPFLFAQHCVGLEDPIPPKLFGIQCMEYGTYHESILLHIYARETGFGVSGTGYHGMRKSMAHTQPWLKAYLDTLEDPETHTRALQSLDLPYVYVSPDSLVDMRLGTGSGGASKIHKTLYDLDTYYATGVVEGKSHINGTRGAHENNAAVVQMLAQMLSVELDEQDLVDKAQVRSKWADLCSYNCVTKLSSAFQRGRACGIPQQRCEAWRIEIADVSIAVHLCDIVRRFRESLDHMSTYTNETYPIARNEWETLDLERKLTYTPMFYIEDYSCPDPPV